MPGDRPRHLAAARSGRRRPRPRADGGRAGRRQAAGQPPAAAADGAAGSRGTIVTLRHRLRRPAVLASGHHSAHAASSGRAALRRGHLHRGKRHGPGAGARPGRHHHRRSAGPAAAFRQPGRHGPARRRPDRRHPAGQRGVRALYAVSGQMAAHGQELTLITAPGSAAHMVLDLVRLAHAARDRRLPAAARRGRTHALGPFGMRLFDPNGPGACPRSVPQPQPAQAMKPKPFGELAPWSGHAACRPRPTPRV